MGKIFKALFALLGVVVIAGACIVAIAQTSWFRSRLEEKLHEMAKESGFSLKIGHLQGSIPLRWELTELQLTSSDGLSIDIDSLRFRIAFLPLLRKEVGISYLKAEHLKIHPGKETKGPVEQVLFEIINQFPFNLSVRAFRIEALSWIDPNYPLPVFSLKGTAKIKLHAHDLLLKITLRTKDNTLEEEIFAVGGKKRGTLEISWKNRIVSLKTLADALSLPYEARLQSQIDLKGPWQTWQALSSKEPSSSAPLSGQLFARVDGIIIPGYEVLDQPWKVRSTFHLKADRTLEIEKGSLRSSLGSLTFQDITYSEEHSLKGGYSLEIPSLEPFSKVANQRLKGVLKADGRVERNTVHGKILIEHGQLSSFYFSSLQGIVGLSKAETLWNGGMQLSIDEKTLHVEGSSKLSYAPGKTLTFTDLALTAPSLHVGGDLTLDLRDRIWEGTARLQADDLSALDPLFPESALGGMVGAELQFLKNGDQSLRINAKSTQLQMKHLQIADSTLYADLHLLSSKPLGTFDLHAERVYLPNVYLASVDLHLLAESALWHFSADTEGTWKEPFRVTAKGTYFEANKKSSLSFESVQGKFLNHDIKLEQPCSIDFFDHFFALSDTTLLLGQGRLTGHCSFDQQQWQLFFQGSDVPLAWLTLFTPYLSLEGETTVDCALKGDPYTVQGSCQLTLKELKAKRFGMQPLSRAKGSLMAHFEGQRVQLHTEFHASEGQVVLFDASIPLELRTPPDFPIRVATEAPWSSSLLVEGKLEEFSEFFNTGFHQWKGWIEGKVLFSGSLRTPQIQGNLAIHQGSYELDLIGLQLENIEAVLQATRDEILLTSLEATGPKKEGTIKGTGSLRLRSGYDFPYHFSATGEHLKAVSLDLVEATLTGSLEIEGTSKKAIARGILEVDEASFSIPRSLPTDLPDLPVTFVNQPAHVETIMTSLVPTFPFHLDLNLHANDSISFDASGLTSRWTGDVHLHGVNLNLLASGTLRLVRGQFGLLGKTFQLNQGEISFSDRPGQDGLLNISGTLNMSDITITAQLRGTLTSPQLYLQSVPPMTTSDIFSLILFNKKVTEIKPMQAVQLAHTIMSLSGNAGWNFVGQIGSGLTVLGIDTFDIIPSEEGLNQTSITIGKHFYLVRGVLVSLTQSLTSSRFTVDVDLGGGVLFQAENQSGENQSQQVGKLSLKWNKNY